MTSSQANAIAAFAAQKLHELEARDLRRVLRPTRRGAAGASEREGRTLISFSDNDYLGLSQDPRVKEAAARAARDYGAGAGASRLITGESPLYAPLEEKLAAMKGTEAALVFGSGYLANMSLIPALAREGDAVFLDELSHSCMHAGARLSRARVETFRHNDVEDLRRRLETASENRKLVLTETVFSMDGDIAPLAEIGAECERAGAWMITDDAHGFGVLKLANPAPIQMGTLSKAAGAYGGYVCGGRALTDLLINRARGLVFTTGLPPAALGAALEALSIMEREPERAARALRHARHFCAALGLPVGQSAIAPVLFGEARAALDASEALLAEGLLVTAIRPPTVPPGTARLRVAFAATHREEDVERLVGALAPLLEARG